MTRTILVAVLLLTVAQRAIAETPEQLYEQGQTAFDAKDYDAALVAWQQSYEQSKEPALLYNIGQAFRFRALKGDCHQAAEAYRKFIALDPNSSQRQIAEGFAEDAEKCAAAERPVTTISATSDSPVESPGSPGRGKKIFGLALAGSGVLFLATAIYFGHKASSLGDEVTNTCAMGCNWAIYGPKEADGRSAETKQYVFYGLGAGAIIGGGVFYWLGARETSKSAVAITSQRGGAVLTWSGSW